MERAVKRTGGGGNESRNEGKKMKSGSMLTSFLAPHPASRALFAPIRLHGYLIEGKAPPHVVITSPQTPLLVVST